VDYTLSDLPSLPRINFSIAPQEALTPPLALSRLRDIVYSCQVRARGWYFPHVTAEALVSGPDASYIEHETEAQGFVDHLERWRLYASGQFVFEEMLWEVPNAEVQARMRQSSHLSGAEEAQQIRGFVSFVGLIYYISEAYTFAANLAQTAPYRSQINIHTEVKGVQKWALGSTDFGVDIAPYTARATNLISRKSFGIDELVADPLNLAVASITEIFQQFGFLEPSPRMISTWQSNIFRVQKRA
jgi:hypothetical protein